MKKYIYLTFAVVLVLFSNSCQREMVTYTYEKDCAGATFQSSKRNFTMVKEDGNKVVVELYRGNTKGDVSIAYTWTDNTGGIFVPEKKTFDFKDGENVATVNVTYPNIEDFLAEIFTFSMSIDDKQVALTGISTIECKAQRQLTRVSIGEATVTSEWNYGETYTANAYSTVEAPNLYYIEDCYTPGYEFTFTVNGDGTVTVPNQAEYNYDPYGEVFIINASGTISGKTVTIVGDWYLEAIGYSFGTCTDTIVLP